jgi:hypothetical protein
MASKDMRGGNYAAELQPKEIYRDRRRRLFERVGEGTVVMWGAGDDRGYGDVGTFRQGSNFFYLTGVELPNAVVVLRPGEGGDLLFPSSAGLAPNGAPVKKPPRCSASMK